MEIDTHRKCEWAFEGELKIAVGKTVDLPLSDQYMLVYVSGCFTSRWVAPQEFALVPTNYVWGGAFCLPARRRRYKNE